MNVLDRQVRVFVSSTFRDMRDERDELILRIFPKLRQLCASRCVTWSEVDLRWGITDEQKAEGRILPICLDEIQRCRPFFIGLLGERYGWIDRAFPEGLLDREPWLREHLREGKSITELEILHGVLNDPAMATRGLFYFRDPAYSDLFPPDRRMDFLCGSEEERRKLALLKSRIEASGLPLRKGYRDPKALGEMVLADLTALLDEIYPEEATPDPRAREALAHESTMRELAFGFVGRSGYIDQLDAHASGEGPPLVVVGESGIGKSALLASWFLRYRESHPQEFALAHFVGASPTSSDWADMIVRILAELKRRFQIGRDIPDRAEELPGALANFLQIAARGGRTILLIDGVDQLSGRADCPEMRWLPPTLPENIRLIVSRAAPRPGEGPVPGDWPVLALEGLDLDDRRRLVETYLARYAKTLSVGDTDRLTAAPQCENPLFLRVLLSELRVSGAHEGLRERLLSYLEAASPQELFVRVLRRFERDYEADRPCLVGDAMKLLLASRAGLSESELMDLLGDGARPMPRAPWSTLYVAAEGGLVTRSGLIGFRHRHLQQAAQRLYLDSPESRPPVHRRLAAYFRQLEPGPRRVLELPWQYASAEDFDALAGLLADVDFLEAGWRNDPLDVRQYWARLQAGGLHSPVEAYRSLLQGPADSSPEQMSVVAKVFFATGALEEAAALWTRVAEHAGHAKGSELYLEAMTSLAAVLIALGDLHRAKEVLSVQEQACRATDRRRMLGVVLGEKARIASEEGQPGLAVDLCMEQQEIAESLDDLWLLQESLGIQARVVSTHPWMLRDDEGAITSIMSGPDYRGAEQLYRRQADIAARLGDKQSLLSALSGRTFCMVGARPEGTEMALPALWSLEQVCRELGDWLSLASCLERQAVILTQACRLDEALGKSLEAERHCVEARSTDLLISVLLAKTATLRLAGDLDAAVGVLLLAERLCREEKTPKKLGRVLQLKADLCRRMARREDANAALSESGSLSVSETLATLVRSLAAKKGPSDPTEPPTSEAL